MQGEPAEGLSPKAQRRLAITAAAIIAAAAVLLGAWIALKTPQYEAASRLSYSPAGLPAGVSDVAPLGGAVSGGSSSSLPVGPRAAISVAATVLNDAELTMLMDRYDLYAKLRQTTSDHELVGRLRRQLSLTEPEPDVLQVTFRDPDQEKAAAFTNGVGILLSAYQVESAVAAAPVEAAKTKGKQRKKREPARPVRPAAPEMARTDVSALSHEIARVNDTIQDLDGARGELLQQKTEVANKVAALERTERRESATDARVGAQDGSHERMVLEQEITAQKARLAGLRDRYTEQYPDVQRAETDLADLQTRLGRLPAPNAVPPAAPVASSAEMQRLKQEQERVASDLERNTATRSAEEARKADLETRMQQARLVPRASSNGAPVVPQDVPVQPAAVQVAPAVPVQTVTVAILPFRIVQRAGSAGLVGTSRLALAAWLAAGTLVLLALCFVPMVPAHYAAVITAPEDLVEDVPEHVTYLGDTGGTGRTKP